MNFIQSVIATYDCSIEEAEFFLHNNSNKAVLFDNGSTYIPQSWNTRPTKPNLFQRLLKALERLGKDASYAIHS